VLAVVSVQVFYVDRVPGALPDPERR